VTDENHLEDLLESKYIPEPIKEPSIKERVVNYFHNLYSRLRPRKEKLIGKIVSIDWSDYFENHKKYKNGEISWEEYQRLNSKINPRRTERLIYAQPKVGRENPYLEHIKKSIEED